MYPTSARSYLRTMLFLVIFSSALAYTPRLYPEEIYMRPEVSYVTYDTSSKEQTDNIITFAQFGEGNLLPESCKGTESGDKSDDN